MENLIEWLFLILAGTGFAIYLWLAWNIKFWKRRGVNGPEPTLLNGNIGSLFSFSNHMSYDLDRIYKQYKGKENFVGIFVSRTPRLLIINPYDCQNILIRDFRHFQDNDIIFPVDLKVDRLIAQNPFVLRGTEWKEKRAEISPGLTPNRIKAGYPVMLGVGKLLSDFIESQLENCPQDGLEARDISARYTIEVVSNLLFGIEAGAFSKDECQVLKIGSQILGGNTMFDIVYFFTAASIPFIKKIYYNPLISKKTENFFTNLMRDAIKLREQNQNDRTDFLNFLLHLRTKKNLSEFDMTAHTLTFFVDGFETSGVLISHVIHMLAKHKDVQEKLRQEIKGALSEDGCLPFDKLITLPYLDSVINETIRLFPPIPFISKICTERTHLVDFKGKHIPIEKDEVVILPIYSIHRDPQYYENPNEFIPDRFSDGVKKYKDVNVFFPFGDGPRICLGMRYALTQTKAAIVELTLNWEMTLNKKTKTEFVADPKNFLLVMDGGVWVDYKRVHESKKTV